MLTQQISVFIENTKGRLSKITGVLAKEDIDIIAISIADTTNFGILRCIVNDPKRALTVLKNAGKPPYITNQDRLKYSPASRQSSPSPNFIEKQKIMGR